MPTNLRSDSSWYKTITPSPLNILYIGQQNCVNRFVRDKTFGKTPACPNLKLVLWHFFVKLHNFVKIRNFLKKIALPWATTKLKFCTSTFLLWRGVGATLFRTRNMTNRKLYYIIFCRTPSSLWAFKIATVTKIKMYA